MPTIITAVEYLEISSVPLATPAWRILSLDPLWRAAALLGTDTDIAGVDGALPNPRWTTATPIALSMWIGGRKDHEGTVNADARAGLKANLNYLHANVIDQPATDDGTRAAVWHQAGGTTVSVSLHVLDLAPRGLSPAAIYATLQLSIPSGRFA